MTMPSERNQNIHALRVSGATLVAIAKRYEITRERVRQIYLKTDRQLARKKERDLLVEEAGLVAATNGADVTSVLAKLDAIVVQLDEIKRELDVVSSPVFDLPVNVLELGARAHNCLRDSDVTTIGDLLALSERDLLRTPNFGRKCLKEIREALASLGCALPIS